ncbi:predicted protein [Plenodomus lingam JN3]|uniref:Predicted protein n=1 Tax=Leptosphaeria maculans (strain JN3 / isolate v23.1.3 / race Av1-4-5-6-7-8) TaxID=985895 RepID=E4ZM17_LEPMJ|nr:predicted protein [Plenodomus lingam JN3]CBX92366.1 predicted protein [Plenodomus lingam JN3]
MLRKRKTRARPFECLRCAEDEHVLDFDLVSHKDI